MEPKKETSTPARGSGSPVALLGVLVSSIAIIGWFRSKARVPRGQGGEAARNNGRMHQCPNDSGDDSYGGIGTAKSERPPNLRECRYPEKKPTRWSKRWKPYVFLINLFTLAAVFWYAWVTKNMWKEMQTQTIIQQGAAINAVRAWVGLEAAPQVAVRAIGPKKFEAIITIVVKNFGQGPALKVMADTSTVPGGDGKLDDHVQSSCNLVSQFVGLKPTWQVATSDENTFKREWGSVLFRGKTLSTGGEFSDESYDYVGKEAYVIGCIVYQDQFRKAHWTKFCYNTGDFANQVVRDGSSFTRLYMCNTNNYTDEGEQKQH